ncbi:MAG: hypothetical protein AAF402_09795 [Pseudomonadota bacterium]
MNSHYTPAPLDIEQLAKIQSLEESIGKVVVAVQPESEFAQLTGDELYKIQKMEKDLGIVILAYNS